MSMLPPSSVTKGQHLFTYCTVFCSCQMLGVNGYPLDTGVGAMSDVGNVSYRRSTVIWRDIGKWCNIGAGCVGSCWMIICQRGDIRCRCDFDS